MTRSALSLISLSLSLLTAGCAGSPVAPRSDPGRARAEPQRRVERHFKGVELYCARDPASGGWRFGLLPGTNRLKTGQEVEDALSISGVEKLKEELASFAPGEQVFLVDTDSPIRPAGAALESPGPEVLRELYDFCKARGIAFDAKGIGDAAAPGR